MSRRIKKSVWHVYMLECSDRSLYTGITTDVKRRVDEHNNGPKGAKCTRARRPVKLAYTKKCKDRSDAATKEAAVKKLSRAEKLNLIDSIKK